MNICFIGDGNHAKLIQKSLFKKNINFNLIPYDRAQSLSAQTEVMNCNIIFITSPNSTHAHYLNELNICFDGYVYCEKPPINNIKDLDILRRIDKGRFFFGFNHRYSEILKIIPSIVEKYNFEEMVDVNIHVSYPFSVKPEYKKSWKSNMVNSPYGIVENLGIHYIDLLITLLDNPISTVIHSRNINNTGTSNDTATIFHEYRNNCTSRIFVSYATIAKEYMEFTFKNGTITYNGSKFTARYPRETFNQGGLSITPPIVYTKKIDSDMLHLNSLEKCLDEFMYTIINHKKFNHNLAIQTEKSVIAMFKSV
jgi:predicted dehydrogenase